MKNIIIKLGKAVSAIREQGVIKGGSRVMKSVKSLFRKVGDGEILFVTGGVGDSARYRTEHVKEELEIQGFRCSIAVQDNPFLARYADRFKIFIFHRVLWTTMVAKLVRKIKKQKKIIIFETDDLVFDPKYLCYMDYYRKMNMFEKKQYEKGVGGEILKDPYVAVATTTTSYLAQILKNFVEKVFIVRNKLSLKDIEITDSIIKMQKKDEGKILIGYFSGTKSHDKDFMTCSEALVKIMKKHKNVNLFLAGPLNPGEDILKFGSRIIRFPYVERKKHFENVYRVNINIAPLELGNPFCESKSELKFFEAGILKVPTVAAANRTFSEVIEDGIDGFLAAGEKEWFEKLDILVSNKKLRRLMGERARNKTLREYTTSCGASKEYYEYLRNQILKISE